jgi:hypothetical protein
MEVEPLVVRDGDLVTASGRVVRYEAVDWFEPLSAVAAPALGGGSRVVRPASPVAIRVTGADVTNLTNRFEADGMVEGFASLTGTWSPDRLQVQHQGVPGPRMSRFLRWVTPPCLPPAGGWPRNGGIALRFDLGDLLKTGAVLATAVFRPGPEQEVLVVAAMDPDRAEARLQPQLGACLCVVPSRWGAADLAAVRDYLSARHRAWNLTRLAVSVDENGQACLEVGLTRVMPEIASWASGLPDGILLLDPWLRHAPTQDR